MFPVAAEVSHPAADAAVVDDESSDEIASDDGMRVRPGQSITSSAAKHRALVLKDVACSANSATATSSAAADDNASLTGRRSLIEFIDGQATVQRRVTNKQTRSGGL